MKLLALSFVTCKGLIEDVFVKMCTKYRLDHPCLHFAYSPRFDIIHGNDLDRLTPYLHNVQQVDVGDYCGTPAVAACLDHMPSLQAITLSTMNLFSDRVCIDTPVFGQLFEKSPHLRRAWLAKLVVETESVNIAIPPSCQLTSLALHFCAIAGTQIEWLLSTLPRYFRRSWRWTLRG